MTTDLSISVTPQDLRDMADELEREGTSFQRLVPTDQGVLLEVLHLGRSESMAICPACGQLIDHCQGHGASGDPVGYAMLHEHDNGRHKHCHANSECQRDPSYAPPF